MRIIVLGKDGQVGRELSIASRDGWEILPVGRAECDLSDPSALRDLVHRLRPEIIVNAAAYTAVDQAEQERDLCFAINSDAPRVLAEEAQKLGTLLIHYSTDYVFDGEKQAPYIETDSVRPLNVYGASKAAGEMSITEVGGRFLILRTTWVFSAYGKNFLRTILRLSPQRPELRIVNDQVGAPTSAQAIAAATWRLVELSESNPISSGIYHMTASGSASWYDFALAIVNSREVGIRPEVHPIPSSEFPTPARRPKNSILSNQKFEQAFGFRLSSWKTQLKDELGRLASLPSGAPTDVSQ